MRRASVEPFLTGLFDYAGLFPPASLDMEAAVREYLNHKSSGDRWMLGPFVVPMDRLTELRAFSNLFDPADPFALDILLPGASSADTFAREIPLQLANCRMFSDRHPTTGVVAFETRLPKDVLTADRARRIFESLSDALEFAGFGHTRLFFELDRGPTFQTQTPAVFDALADLGSDRLAAKLRCGGTSAEDFPPPEQVASFIRAGASTGQPFKLTAGLHHPIRHHDNETGAMMHGFLNLMFATVLAAAHDLDETRIVEIVSEEDASAFMFEDAVITWGDLDVDVDRLRATRRDVALSIGSCSFDEPREDMVDLGWLSLPG